MVPSLPFLPLADALPDPLLLTDSTGQLLACNRVAQQRLELAATAIGQPLRQHLADEAGSFDGYLRLCARSRSPLPGSLHFRRRDGSVERFRCWGGVVQPRSGEQSAVILLRIGRPEESLLQFRLLNERIAELNREIQRRKQAEADRRHIETQMLQAQKLESLGVLAGGIAHDFNNLLTSIIGYTDLAQMDLPAGSPALAHLEQVLTSARRAAELTQQMLAYSGRGQFVVRPVRLSALIEELSRLLEVSLSKRCTLVYRLDGVPLVLADASQLRQVVMNLVHNAAEAIGDRPGTITVATRSLNCDPTRLANVFLDEPLPEGRYVVLEVRDNGCGMTAETRARMFEPFFSTKFTGRGLGLAAVLGIVRGHHGAIRVESEPGQGTTFQVFFPAHRDAADPDSSRSGV